MPRRRPEFGPGGAGAEAAKLASLAMQAGPKFSGCPTRAEPNFSVYLCITAGFEYFSLPCRAVLSTARPIACIPLST